MAAISPEAGAPVLGDSLSDALGYVARWQGRSVVVKIGGSAMAGVAATTLADDLVRLARVGVRPVLVHGGGPMITQTLERLGIRSQFVDGLRVTDAPTMEVVEMVLAGSINKQLVAAIQAAGGTAVGLSGVDGNLLQARPRSAGPDLGFVGEVAGVAPEVLRLLLEARVIPVVASLGLDGAGQRYNLNADTAAAALAVALGAQKLILMTDVDGIYREATDGGRERISELSPQGARELMSDGTVRRGMIPKVEACLDALAGGVASSHIIAAAQAHGLLIELLTEAGTGTMIRPAR